MAPPYAYFRTPLYFEFSSALLRAGVNKIEVHLVSVRYAAFMEPFYSGLRKASSRAYAYANFLQVTLVRAAIVALLLIFLLTLGLFWVRPADTGYGWFCRGYAFAGPRTTAAARTAHADSAGRSVVLAAADRARLVLDLLGAVHQSPARLRRPAAADGARIPRLRRDRLAGDHRASPHDARKLVDPGLCLAPGHHAHQCVHRMASAACRAPHSDVRGEAVAARGRPDAGSRCVRLPGRRRHRPDRIGSLPVVHREPRAGHLRPDAAEPRHARADGSRDAQPRARRSRRGEGPRARATTMRGCRAWNASAPSVPSASA